ncbi:bifunctional folylpolyglutamate synthase/dihydrofolate synthase [Pseudonocardia sp. CA-107938]|uniref:bifunctional folylpolyglutamate synthase/dihydrofolate synthase n=1 Tax=Pseudonocardia sp. CA-107938 TaxID=3240021 RepID=UPI003D8B432C
MSPREDGYDDDYEEGLVGPDDGFSEAPEPGAEGTGELPDPEDALIARVLDQIRGAETPDVVPAQSTVAGFAEFLAVDAVLDQRWPETVMEPSLEKMRAVVELLGDPHRGYPVVHLTGTNGKTSTARMIDAILSEIGLRTGRYTSPQLQRTTERINIDNRPITAERFVELYRDVLPYVELVDQRIGLLSKFEVLTAMGFAAFADAPVEAAVLEVGLGGSWDATNVADGDVAVITPIGIDHVKFLGADVLSIAREKSGIIKPGAVAVLAAQDTKVAELLVERCVEVDAQVAREGAEFGVREREIAVGGQRLSLQGLGGQVDDIFLPLHGEYQASNAALALAAAEALVGAGPQQPIDPDAIRAAFASVRSPGRLERLVSEPGRASVFADAAHNPAGARALAGALTSDFRFERLVGVLAVLGDKDVRGILTELEPVLQEVVVTTNSSPRAMDPDELGALASEVFGAQRVSVETELARAVEQAVELAEESGGSGVGVVITGSVVTAGEARTLYGKEPS